MEFCGVEWSGMELSVSIMFCYSVIIILFFLSVKLSIIKSQLAGVSF